MAVAAAPGRRPNPASASGRIWALITRLPTNPDGAVYFRPLDIDNVSGVAPNSMGKHTAAVLAHRATAGTSETIRLGRRIVGVRSTDLQPKGSQTSRIRAVLAAYADDRGRAPLTGLDLQRIVGADLHDVTKGLHDLKQRGLLTFDFAKDGSVRDLRLSKSGRAAKFEDVADHLPLQRPTVVPKQDGPPPVVTMDLLPSDIGLPDDMSRDDAYVQGIADAERPDAVGVAGLAERYPLIAHILNRPAQFEAAAEALSALGGEYENQAMELLGKAENCYTPFEAEVVALVKEVTAETT